MFSLKNMSVFCGFSRYKSLRIHVSICCVGTYELMCLVARICLYSVKGFVGTYVSLFGWYT